MKYHTDTAAKYYEPAGIHSEKHPYLVKDNPSRHMTLKFDCSVSCPLLPFPTALGWHNAHPFLITRCKDPPGLPPFIITCICYVKDVTVTER